MLMNVVDLFTPAGIYVRDMDDWERKLPNEQTITIYVPLSKPPTNVILRQVTSRPLQVGMLQTIDLLVYQPATAKHQTMALPKPLLSPSTLTWPIYQRQSSRNQMLPTTQTPLSSMNQCNRWQPTKRNATMNTHT
jgi:hypothetical protein